MGRPPLSIDVPKKDQNELARLLSSGIQQVRVVLRALALLQLAKGASAPRIADMIPLTPQAIRKLGHRYGQGGFEFAQVAVKLAMAYPLATTIHPVMSWTSQQPYPEVAGSGVRSRNGGRSLEPLHGPLHSNSR